MNNMKIRLLILAVAATSLLSFAGIASAKSMNERHADMQIEQNERMYTKGMNRGHHTFFGQHLSRKVEGGQNQENAERMQNACGHYESMQGHMTSRGEHMRHKAEGQMGLMSGNSMHRM